MLTDEIRVDRGPAESSKKLRCPICGDSSVTFNSRTTVSLRGAVEWLAIFACTDSHVFFVPMTNAPSLGLGIEAKQSPSLTEMGILVRDRIERVRATVLSATASVDASRHLLQNVRRTSLKWRSRRRARSWDLPTSCAQAETIN
jgi:hypothetical protein